MKPAPFRYHAPTTLDEAVATLAAVAPDDGRVLAGGQSLVPIMAFRLARPPHLVDINGIAELRRMATVKDKLTIGACVRHAAFYREACEGPLGRLLASVVRHIGHHPIRTRGTFCGSLAHADPASEWCLVAATLDAEMVATSSRGARTIAAKDFFAGIMTTALAEDELLTQARLPLLPSDTRFGFCEFSRRAGDFALAMALVAYRLEDGAIVEPHSKCGNPMMVSTVPQVDVSLYVGDPAKHAPNPNFGVVAGLQLSAGSPCLDAGVNLQQPYPAVGPAYDMGAYEHQ